jgi:hypothetical protein
MKRLFCVDDGLYCSGKRMVRMNWQPIKDFPKDVEEGTRCVLADNREYPLDSVLIYIEERDWYSERDCYQYPFKKIKTYTHFLILPPLPDPDEGKPTFADLKGAAPDITGDMSSEDYMAKQREENWGE